MTKYPDLTLLIIAVLCAMFFAAGWFVGQNYSKKAACLEYIMHGR